MSVYDALREVQTALRAPKNQNNSFGKYKYRSAEDILEAVKPLLAEHSLALTISDEPIEVNGRTYVRATATVTNSEGDQVSVTGWAREPDTKKGMDDAQITGATSSYARKYAMNGLFAIDDSKDADTDEHAKQTGRGSSGGGSSKQSQSRPSSSGKSEAKAGDPEIEKARERAKKALSDNQVPPDEFREFLSGLVPFWNALKDVDNVEAFDKIVEWANAK